MKALLAWLVISLAAVAAEAQDFFSQNAFEVTERKFVAIEGMSDICINPRLDRLVIVSDLQDVCELNYDGQIVRRSKISLADCEAVQWVSGDEKGDWYALLNESGPRLYWVHFPESVWTAPEETPNTIRLESAETYQFSAGNVEAFYIDGANHNVYAFDKNNNDPAYTRVIRDGMAPVRHLFDPHYTMADLKKSHNNAVRSCFYNPQLCTHPIRLHDDSKGNYRLQEFDDSTGQVLSQSQELPLNKCEGIVFKDMDTAYAVADKKIGNEAENFFVIRRR